MYSTLRTPFFLYLQDSFRVWGATPISARGAHQCIQETHPVPSSRPPQLWRNPPGKKKRDRIHIDTPFQGFCCAGNVDLKISANKKRNKNQSHWCHRNTFRESIQLLAFPQRFNTNPNWDLCKLEAGELKLAGDKHIVLFSKAGKHVQFIDVHDTMSMYHVDTYITLVDWICMNITFL